MNCSSVQQLKLRTRCARYRKLGHWARECPEGNRGQRNDERCGEARGQFKKGSSLEQGTRHENRSFLELPGRSSLSTLEKSCGILAFKRDSSGNSN